jgi:lipoprotein-anchoring transpeptidase ErfK/SrfK
LYKRPLLSSKFEVMYSYSIAVGRAGYETPSGLYLIRQRSDCPTWTMPDSDWVEPQLRGVVIPCGDPANPIRARWLGIHDGVGIHGTLERESIGTAASHGCLRMLVEDVIELYPQVPKNTPIYIV